MSGRRREGISPSLFPFLAVLICTLGTLILLLALVAQNATDAAKQNAQAKRSATEKAKTATAPLDPGRLTAETVDSMLEEEQFRVTQLVAFRDKQTAEVENRRDHLTHIEDHMQRLRTRLRRLNDEVNQAMGETQSDLQVDLQMITMLQRQLESEREEIERLRADSEHKTPRVVIVPHKGPNGTDRRPVYLECDEDGITIWPEGSHITMSQLVDSAHSANPLDAALRVIRLHAMQQYGDTVPPYPLLVVRPDGIEAYGAARMAMRDWDDQFGYELIPAEVELAFHQPDEALKRRIDFVIRDAAAHQQAIRSIARGRGGGRGLGNGQRGGVAMGGTTPSRPLPTLSAASLDRAGRANGFRSHRDSSAYNSSQSGRGPTIGSSPYSGSSGSFNGQDAGAAARQWTDKMRSAAEEMRYDKYSSSGTSSGHEGLGSQNSSTAFSGLGDPSPQQDATSQDSASSGNDGADSERGQRQASTGKSSVGRSAGFEMPSENQRLNGTAGGSSEISTDDSGDTSATESKRDGGKGSLSTSQMSKSQTQGNGGTQASGSPPSQRQASRASSSRSSSASASQSAPQMNFDANQEPPLRRQGKDWALPASVAGAHGNAIVRSIRIQCYPDRFVLMPPGTGGATEMFGFSSDDVDRATMKLATAVRTRIQRWGPALPGGRWQPQLDVIVMPRGEVRFHQLRTLMRDSGVEVTGRASR